MNEQFNQQYDEAIATIQSRALWRIGERRSAGETFRCSCLHCRSDTEHLRVDITRHRVFCGKPIRQLEPARAVVQCRRCGTERHTRDIGELIVPTTIRLYDDVRTKAAEMLSTRATDVDTGLRHSIAAFCEEASGPVRAGLLTHVASDVPDAHRATLELIGRELLLNTTQIDAALVSFS